MPNRSRGNGTTRTPGSVLIWPEAAPAAEPTEKGILAVTDYADGLLVLKFRLFVDAIDSHFCAYIDAEIEIIPTNRCVPKIVKSACRGQNKFSTIRNNARLNFRGRAPASNPGIQSS